MRDDIWPIGENPYRNDWPIPQLWSELRDVSETSDYCMRSPAGRRTASDTVLDIAEDQGYSDIREWRSRCGIAKKHISEKERSILDVERSDRIRKKQAVLKEIMVRHEEAKIRKENTRKAEEHARARRAAEEMIIRQRKEVVDDANEAFRASIVMNKPFMATITGERLGAALWAIYGFEIPKEQMMQKAVNVYCKMGFLTVDDYTDGEILPDNVYCFFAS